MASLREDRAPSIIDVARVAGVSVPTVSRVLTGSTPVSDKLRGQVSAAIDTLGFRPNGAARSLVSGRRSMIAVLTGNAARSGWARTIQGIEVAARTERYSAIVAVVETGEPSDVNAAVDLVLAQNVAGVIVLEFDVPGRQVLKQLPANIPVVAAAGGSRRPGPIPYALLDERRAGQAATEHLLALGHHTVHHVAQPTLGRATPRTAGWLAALKAAHVPVPKILHASWDPRTAYRCGLELVTHAPTAVFCANDDIAIAVMRAFTDSGLAVPDDVSVVGFDDQPLSEFWTPALTTVHQDFEDLGARAFTLLSGLIQHRNPGHSVTTPLLVTRASTAPPPSPDG